MDVIQSMPNVFPESIHFCNRTKKSFTFHLNNEFTNSFVNQQFLGHCNNLNSERFKFNVKSFNEVFALEF